MPRCMSAAEFAFWQDANLQVEPPHDRARRPCLDCTTGYAQQMRAGGNCNGVAPGEDLYAMVMDLKGKGLRDRAIGERLGYDRSYISRVARR